MIIEFIGHNCIKLETVEHMVNIIIVERALGRSLTFRPFRKGAHSRGRSLKNTKLKLLNVSFSKLNTKQMIHKIQSKYGCEHCSYISMSISVFQKLVFRLFVS